MKNLIITSIMFVGSLSSGGAQSQEATSANELAIETAKKAVEATLKDPYSAQYRNVRAFEEERAGMIVCGEVNAKNSYGGYTGFEGFVYWKDKLTMPGGGAMPSVDYHYRQFVKLLCDGKPKRPA